MRVIVMRGVPGSGKSHWAQSLTGSKVVVSADHHFINSDGEYEFDPAKLADAHNACLRRFLEELQNQNTELLIVDNTNSTIAEMAPYMALAAAFGAPAEIVEVKCDPTTAVARNVHGVTTATVKRIHDVMCKNTPLMPPWWQHTVITP